MLENEKKLQGVSLMSCLLNMVRVMDKHKGAKGKETNCLSSNNAFVAIEQLLVQPEILEQALPYKESYVGGQAIVC